MEYSRIDDLQKSDLKQTEYIYHPHAHAIHINRLGMLPPWKLLPAMVLISLVLSMQKA